MNSHELSKQKIVFSKSEAELIQFKMDRLVKRVLAWQQL